MDGDERRRSSSSSVNTARRRTPTASGSSRRQSGKEGGSSSSSSQSSRSRRSEAANNLAALLLSASSSSCKKPDIKGILVRAGDQAEMTTARNGKSRGTTEDNSNSNEAAAYHNTPVLAPLLKLLPKHVDPSTLKTLLKGVHPSAFGTFKTKDTWRKENPDILSNSLDSNRRAESCPAGHHGLNSDDDDVAYSPTGSLSSLADLEEQTIHSEYDDTPATSVSPIPPLPRLGSSSSSISPPRSYLSTPQDLSLRRYRSNSSIASQCTCHSTSSRTSSIRFAPLPEEELQSRERKPQLSHAMGIAGRARMLQSRKVPDDLLIEDSVDEIFDPELRQIDAQFEEDEENDYKNHASDITLRYNEDGEIVEKRPLGVTLEELVFPVKKHRQQERGRSRTTSDLSASFQRRNSSTDPISPPQTATSSPNKVASLSPSPSSSSSSSPLSRHTSEDPSYSAYPTPTQTPKFADLSLEQTPIPTPRSTSPSIPHHHSLGFTPISSPPKETSPTSTSHTYPSGNTEDTDADVEPSPELDTCDSSSPSGSSPESPSSDSSDFEDEEVDDDDKKAISLSSTVEDIPLPQLLMAHNHLRKTANNNVHHARKTAAGIRIARHHRPSVSKKRA